MPGADAVASHYAQGNLTTSIKAGLAKAGKTPETASVEDLAPVDEFHIGGRKASLDFIKQLGIKADHHVLDIGCGMGGTARLVAGTVGCRVSGIDLTTEFVETGTELSRWVGLSEHIELRQGSALDMPFADGAFDGAMMLHVGMNIADKARLFAEVARVLRPGATFGVFDVMRIGGGELTYPVPWSSEPATNALAPPDVYRDALATAGFVITAERDRHAFAVEFFDTLSKRIAAEGGPPPLGLHITMGESAPIKVANMVENIGAGRIAPVEMIARKQA